MDHDPLPELAKRVAQAIDEHANPSDESAATFPGVQLDPTRDADVIDRLKRGEGKAHEVKLHTDASGKQFAVHDWDAAVQARAVEDQAYDADPPADIVSERPDPDQPAYVSSRAPHHDAEAHRVYEHVGAMAGVRLLETLLQGEMGSKEQK